MNTKTDTTPKTKEQKEYTADPNRFANTDRDEATLGVSKNRESDPGLAKEDQPNWQPPESQPEPRPAEPIMNPSQLSNQNTNTQSPA